MLKFAKSAAFLSKTGYFPPPIQYNVENQTSEILGSSSQHCMEVGGEVRQERLYSRLTCAQKRQKCKFVSRFLSMIADSRSSKLLSLWLVLSSPSASSSNGLVLRLVWCSLFPQKSLVQKSRESKRIFHGSRKNRKPVSRGRKNIDSRITGKKKFSFTFHAKQ